MDRRRFILGFVGVGVAAGVIVPVFGRMGVEAEIVAAVRKRLSFLHLDDDGLHQFAQDHVAIFLAKRPSLSRIKTRIRNLFAKQPPPFGFSTDRRSKSQRTADNLATVYLLSSDFFVNGSDASRIVQYVAHYDPLRACSNPFARKPPSA